MVPGFQFQFDSRGFNIDPIWEIPIAFCIEYFKLGENSQAFYSVLVFILYANASCVIGSPISYLPCPLYFLHYYKGNKVVLHKRAQILVADLWQLFEGKGLCNFSDIDGITMFADYRVPQSLQYFGAFQYSDSLFQDLKNEKLLGEYVPA